MSLIFPGMDPYLESADFWHGFHQRMIVYLADHLQPKLRPRYVAAVEERVYLEGPNREVVPDVGITRGKPGARRRRGRKQAVAVGLMEPVLVRGGDPEVHESYVTVLDLSTGQRVVTVIELVSPANKYAGPGRESYLTKQREVLASEAHLVEIDLHRLGPHVLAVPEWATRRRGPYDYLISVNRAEAPRNLFEIYPLPLRDPLPRFGIPLAGDDPDVALDLQAVFTQTYERGCYDDRIDYRHPCYPPLPPEHRAWADELIRAAGVVGPPTNPE